MFLQKQSVFMLEVQKDYRNVSERYEMWKVLTQHYQRVDADQVVPKRKNFCYHQSLKKSERLLDILQEIEIIQIEVEEEKSKEKPASLDNMQKDHKQ